MTLVIFGIDLMKNTYLLAFVFLISITFVSASYQVIQIPLNVGWNGIGIPFNSSQMDWSDKNISLNVGYNLISFPANRTISSTELGYYSGDNYYNFSEGVNLFDLIINSTFNSQSESIGTPAEMSSITYNFEPYKAYWIYTNTSINLSVKNIYSAKLGETYPLSSLMFRNGSGVEKNITDAVGAGWIGAEENDVNKAVYYSVMVGNTRYWKNIIDYQLAGFSSCQEMKDFMDDQLIDCEFSNWKGYFINGLKNNITIFRPDCFAYYADFVNSTCSSIGDCLSNVNDSNGTVVLNIDNTQILATNTDDDNYEAKHTFSSSGTYPYYLSTYSVDGFSQNSTTYNAIIILNSPSSLDNLSKTILSSLVGIICLTVLFGLLSFILYSITKNFNDLTIRQVISYFVAVIIILNLSLALTNYIAQIIK